MIREHLFRKRASADPLFRWRGGEVSRLEGLSDAVFAFALTLLVVSLEVPKTFDDLMNMIRSFPAFAICFALLINVWYYHYKFFRRYGLEDFLTIVLNSFLLFLILFYVYPLKFVFANLIDPLFGLDHAVIATDGTLQPAIVTGQYRPLMLFYSAGFAMICALFIVMHLYAYRLRTKLELDGLECYLTRGAVSAQMVSFSIAVVSIVLAAVGGSAIPWSGLVYFLMGPAHFVNGYLWGRGAAKLYAEMGHEA
jgi:uncharacterized membrane protein